MSKSQSLLAMLSRAIKKGFVPDYVLFDSWFMSNELLDKIRSYYSKTIKVIAMIRIGNTLYSDCLTKKDLSAGELRKKYRKNIKRSRRHNARYIKVAVNYGNNRVNIFFIRLGRSKKWKAIMTTDLGINFNRLMEIYHIRWSIEVFFKDAKQYLQLGKCQGSNFDSQIASITISMIRYLMLIWYKQIHYDQSLGSLFDKLSIQTQEESIARHLTIIFWDIVEKIGQLLKIDIMEFMVEIIREDEKAKKVFALISPETYKKLCA